MFLSKIRFFVGFLAIFSFILLAGASCQNNQDIYSQDNTNTIQEPSNSNNSPIVGGDKDEHGCLVSAGYSWCEPKQKCLRSWEEECPAIVSKLDEKISPVNKQPDSIVDSVAWNEYTNQKFDYTVLYPDNSQVSGNDLDQYVAFLGPEADGEHWPNISISHFNIDLYHPDPNVDLKEWLGISPEVTTNIIGIDAIPTLHVVQPKTIDSEGADYYYFVKDGQLFKITLLHTTDRQDWPMYMKFIASFHFNNQTSNGDNSQDQDTASTTTSTVDQL